MGDGQYIFRNVLGEFVLDKNFKIVEKPKSKAGLKEPSPEDLKKVLKSFKEKKYFKPFFQKNIEITKHMIKESVGKDNLVIQTINHLDELKKITNMLAKRLREWYELYNPEFSHVTKSHEQFVDSIIKKSKKDLQKSIGLTADKSMGAQLEREDIQAMLVLAQNLNKLYELKQKQEKYLEAIMKQLCPNMTAISGVLIGAKLLAHAGSLKRLSQMPASTIQILGAEKALFRHLKTGAKSPRHGLIVQHEFFEGALQKMHGKIARALADKIAIAVKVDYFKGEPIGEKLRKGLEKRFKK